MNDKINYKEDKKQKNIERRKQRKQARGKAWKAV